MTAVCMTAAVATRWMSIPASSAGGSAVVMRVTAAPRSRAARARARPILPLERLPRTRTGSSGSRVPPAVTRQRLPARSPRRPSSRRMCPIRASGSSMRPSPPAPEAWRPLAGPATATPSSRRRATLRRVAGWLHISVSIAGATSTGARVPSAVSASRSSASPCASRARVWAVAGAMASRSASAASLTCGMPCGTPRAANRSVCTVPGVSAAKVAAVTKRAPAAVRITSTCAPCCTSALTSAAAL